METQQNKQQFQLISIITTEANFRREDFIDENYNKVKNKIELNVAKHFGKDDFGVFLTVGLKQEFEGKTLVEFKITTSGIFKKNGEIPEEVVNNFCDINAPAIIFPFVREIIANLSMKGGLQPVIIQPINFVELSKQRPSKEKS